MSATRAHYLVGKAGAEVMESPPDTRVEVGQRYEGWGRKWEVVRVWDQGVADIVCVDDPTRKMRLPVTQFKELPRA